MHNRQRFTAMSHFTRNQLRATLYQQNSRLTSRFPLSWQRRLTQQIAR